MFVIRQKTISKAWEETVAHVLAYGTPVENTLELQNTCVVVSEPFTEPRIHKKSYTETAAKFIDQMMLRPLKDSSKLSHFSRLYETPCLVSNQIGNVLKRLKEKPTTRRAVIDLWQPSDIEKDYALCWCMAQFLLRDDKLHMTTFYRSNDAYNAFHWNAVGCTALQAELAFSLDTEVGTYTHFASSMHIYKKDVESAETIALFEEEEIACTA